MQQENIDGGKYLLVYARLTEQGVGEGIFCRRPGVRNNDSLGQKTRIFRIETYIKEMCIREILDNSLNNKLIKIISDSQVALKILEAHKSNWKLIWINFKGRNLPFAKQQIKLWTNQKLFSY